MLNNMQMQTGVGSGKPNPVKDRACNCQILLKGLGENERWNEKDKPGEGQKDKTANKAKAGQSGQERGGEGCASYFGNL
jgi:hypothetical protein